MAGFKVFGWLSHAPKDHPAREHMKSWHSDLRCIVAAKSKAAAARAAGYGRPSQMFNLGETGNEEEIAAASMHPLVPLCRGLDARGVPWVRYLAQ